MAELSIDRPDLRVSRLVPDAQLLLHGEPKNTALLARLGGIELGEEMLRATRTGPWSALHLSPDEWLLIGPLAEQADVTARFASTDLPLSLVDISERSLGVELGGPNAARLLNCGCPLDLSDDAFPLGGCTRTLFGKAAVMIWRPSGSDAYRMQYGRSFDAYVTAFVTTAALDLPYSAAPF